ncbi:MAG: AraC family transcriptional regulator, partial [Clostridium baratii]|nr:AraC family transcriptional regulator [Clostridium baratii]
SNIKNIKDELSNAITSSHINDLSYEKDIVHNSILKPAIEYIYSHKNENVSLKKASDLCHISSSYFSRIFSKEVGQNYSTYISKLKIEWAKQLLISTDITVSEISDNLGFNESGYFIKIFKKYESITPSLYRKYHKNLS